jgi:ABC-2 type transport system permease protein
MSKVPTIAKWEFFERVKKKSFIVSLLMMPLIIVLFAVVPSLLASKPDENVRNFGIIDQTDSLASIISKKLAEKYKLPNGKPNYAITVISDQDKDLDHLKKIATAKILDNEIEGYFIIPATVLGVGDTEEIEYRAENVGNIRDQERFSTMLEDVIIEGRLRAAGFDAKRIQDLTKKVDVKTFKISSGGEEEEAGFAETFFSGYIFIMMLMFLVLTTGQMLVRSVVEEKSNRIVEVLMSSCSPMDLMAGKILGLSLLGFTMVAFWVSVLIGVNFATTMPSLPLDNLALTFVYFVLGYLLFAAIFVTIGAPLSTEQEAQQATSYISIILIMPIALAFLVMQNPDSTLVKVLTLIPIFTPSFMAFRLAVQTPALWEIVVSLILLSLSIVGMMWIAAKVFRIGILITGKRPNLHELYRWITTDA